MLQLRTLILRSYSKAKRVLLTLTPLLLGVSWGLPLMAQVAYGGGPPKSTHRRYRRSSLDQRVNALARNLNLSQAQRESVAKILEERRQEALRIRHDTSVPGRTRIERFRALQDQTVQRIRAVLNDEQKKKYDPLAARRLEPAPQQRSVEDWLNSTARQ